MTDEAQAGYELRMARRGDEPAILRLIHALADYEKLTGICHPDAERLSAHLFGERPFAEVILAEVEGEAAGMAFFYHNYSTFLTRPGIFLEDLFVLPDYRGRGMGKALLRRLIDLAGERGCGRVDWMVLDWNRPAIEFYEKAFGARGEPEWRLFRLTRDRFGASRGEATR